MAGRKRLAGPTACVKCESGWVGPEPDGRIRCHVCRAEYRLELAPTGALEAVDRADLDLARRLAMEYPPAGGGSRMDGPLLRADDPFTPDEAPREALTEATVRLVDVAEEVHTEALTMHDDPAPFAEALEGLWYRMGRVVGAAETVWGRGLVDAVSTVLARRESRPE